MEREWLREMRSKRGLTYEELGEMVGTCASNVCNLELGKRGKHGMTTNMAVKFAEALRVAPMTVIRKEMEWRGYGKESV